MNHTESFVNMNFIPPIDALTIDMQDKIHVTMYCDSHDSTVYNVFIAIRYCDFIAI